MHTHTRNFLVALLLFSLADGSQAGDRPDQRPGQQPLAEGFVSSTDPVRHLVRIDGGQLVIDASHAELRGPGRNGVASFDDLRPGAQIAAVLQRGHYRGDQPIPATTIEVLRQQVGTLTGEVDSIDLAAGTFRILGRTIRTTGLTTYRGSVASLDPKSLADLPAGRSVTVFLDGDLDSLTAQSVTAVAPPPDEEIVATGTLATIDGETWQLLHSTITSFQVLRSTSIEGLPRAGDVISVYARVDHGQVTAAAVEVSQAREAGGNSVPCNEYGSAQ
jgi:hypothetical protein